jgi:uncharacterized membrane protein YdjX (TVP38/TMEM64 family)
MPQRRFFKIILIALALILSLLILWQLYLNYLPELQLLTHFNSKNEALLIKMVRSHGFEDLCFLFLLNSVCVAVPGLSNGIFCVLNGILYGPAIGFIINWISDLCGQIFMLLLIVKLSDQEKAQKNRFFKILTTQSFPQLALSLSYVVPFIPSVTVSFANAIINPNFKKRLVPIAIGSLPFAFLYAYGGDSILHLDGRRLLTTIIIFVAITLAGLVLILLDYHKNKKTA